MRRVTKPVNHVAGIMPSAARFDPEVVMRIRLPALIAVAVLVGCSSVPFYRGNTTPAPGLHIASPSPGAAELVASLNANSQRVQTVQCADIDLDCQQGAQMVGLRGGLVCQKPRNFRMTAKVMGNVAVDI